MSNITIREKVEFVPSYMVATEQVLPDWIEEIKAKSYTPRQTGFVASLCAPNRMSLFEYNHNKQKGKRKRRKNEYTGPMHGDMVGPNGYGY